MTRMLPGLMIGLCIALLLGLAHLRKTSPLAPPDAGGSGPIPLARSDAVRLAAPLEPPRQMVDLDRRSLNLRPLPTPIHHPRIVIRKSRRILELYGSDREGGPVRLLRVHPVALGFEPEADKQREGDGATPEGRFYICVKNPRSRYYLSLGLSYPGIEDAQRGLRDGLISRRDHDRIVNAIRRGAIPPWDTNLGGEIFIHGRGAGSDWTAGCIALADHHIDELFEITPLGTEVVIEH